MIPVKTRARAALLLAAFLPALSPLALADREETGQKRATFFISPAGNDRNGGKVEKAPVRTFRRAFEIMSPGDELVLLDGEYSDAAGTGMIHYRGKSAGEGGPDSGQIPSGSGLKRETIVRARNPGKARVVGKLFVGRNFRKDSHIIVDGITFVGGGTLYNTRDVTIRNCGFNGALGIGTNDHHEGNERNLIEDVWIWASGERIIAVNYRSNHNVWRRVVVRGDGCATEKCRYDPNAGITVYDSNHVSLQNVIVLDRILAPGAYAYGDFTVAQHTADPRYHFGRSEWLGTLSIGSPGDGYTMEPDAGQTIDPSIRISNAVAWGSAVVGINIARAGTNVLLENLTVGASRADGIRVAPEMTTGTLRNALSTGAGRVGINSKFPPANVNVHNARASSFSQTKCSAACYTSNPQADGKVPSLRHLVRIEDGSLLKGRGQGGADIGANIVFRYGVDGSKYGEPGFNALSSTELWPWPNQDRIREDMCVRAEVTRGFCGAKSLTNYVWEYLGNPVPAEIGSR